MDRQILIIILGTALVTYLPRMLPLVVLSRMRLPEVFLRWVKFVPAAVLAALLAPGLLLPDGKLALTANPYLLAAIPTVVVAVRTRSMALTILTGMAVMVLVQQWV